MMTLIKETKSYLKNRNAIIIGFFVHIIQLRGKVGAGNAISAERLNFLKIHLHHIHHISFGENKRKNYRKKKKKYIKNKDIFIIDIIGFGVGAGLLIFFQ